MIVLMCAKNVTKGEKMKKPKPVANNFSVDVSALNIVNTNNFVNYSSNEKIYS